MYLWSMVLNFFPFLIVFLIILCKYSFNWDFYEIDETPQFLLFYLLCFIVSSLLNLSFFFLKINCIRNNKTSRFFAYYLSSIFFFILSTILLVNVLKYDIKYNVKVSIMILNILAGTYLYILFFCINYLFVHFSVRLKLFSTK